MPPNSDIPWVERPAQTGATVGDIGPELATPRRPVVRRRRPARPITSRMRRSSSGVANGRTAPDHDTYLPCRVTTCRRYVVISPIDGRSQSAHCHGTRSRTRRSRRTATSRTLSSLTLFTTRRPATTSNLNTGRRCPEHTLKTAFQTCSDAGCQMLITVHRGFTCKQRRHARGAVRR